MNRLLNILSLLMVSISCYSQTDLPIIGKIGYSVSQYLKKDSTGYYFVGSDTSIILHLPRFNDTLRVLKCYDRNYNLLAEGEILGLQPIDYYKLKGKWTEYYLDKKIKKTGYYYDDNPIGLWNIYYPNGNLKETYSITLIENDSTSNYCRTGIYQEYFENGQLKINGFYKTVIDSGLIYMYDIETGKESKHIIQMPKSKEFGIWTYFYENGEIEMKKEFRDDNIIELTKPKK